MVRIMIKDFSGVTYVAYLDVSGFKSMMEQSEEYATKSLNKFYNTVYNVGIEFNNQYELNNQYVEINEIVVSDCAIIFCRNKITSSSNSRIESEEIVSKRKGLRSLLHFITQINKQLIQVQTSPAIMTTCSIAYGKFTYRNRIEFIGIDKEFIIGHAYVNAVQDQYSEPKLQPCECRVLKKSWNPQTVPSQEFPFSLLKEKENRYYFHWMLPSLDDLLQFRREYENSKYIGMTSIIRKYLNRSERR